tara:strand:- start:760 stop:1008 length:249 start_codon:yes stop_codon:yes gene_type:complete
MGAKGSELKRVRQSRKSNLRNRHYKSMMRTAVKRVFAAKKEEASKILSETISTIDKVCAKGVIHKNKASRQKSRLADFVNNL